MIYEIASRSNRRVKTLLGNREDFLFFEGEKLVADIIERGVRIAKLIVHRRREERLRAWESRAGETWAVNDAVLEKISSLKDKPDFIAVVKARKSKIHFNKTEAVMVLDRLQDPANAGTVFRCAAAFGIDSIALTGSGVKPTNPKFLRAAQTSVFDVDFQDFPDIETVIKKSQVGHFNVYLTSSRPSPHQVGIEEIRFPCLVVIGNEGQGLAEKLFEAYPSIRVPHTPRVDSLNAGVTACIIMYELKKQLSTRGG